MGSFRHFRIALPAPLALGKVAVAAVGAGPIALPVLCRRESARTAKRASEVPISADAPHIVVVGR
eukprot:16434370-Heterocapsa_arctica.AAC.1